MTDFVLENYEKLTNANVFEQSVFDYANFLKQPLKKEMFVPFTKEDELFKLYHFQNFNNEIEFEQHLKDYEEAQAKVLFKSFSIIEHTSYTISIQSSCGIFNPFWMYENKVWQNAKAIKTLEDLVKFNLELSDTVSF